MNNSILLDVEGMKCGGCVRSVEQILLDQANVHHASVNLVTRTALLDLKDPSKSLDPIFKALSDRGFIAKTRETNNSEVESSSEANEIAQWWNQWRQLMIAITLLLLSVIGHLAEGGQIQIPLLDTLSFHAILATYALLGPGRKILINGAKASLGLTPSMDTLVGLGVISAYIASLLALFWPQVGWPCFFNEPVMLLGFVLLGRFLEERARFRTGRALKQLAQLQPDKARLLIGDNEIHEVRVGALKPGERVQLLAGDRIPVDGVVLKGNSAVDISSLTGEPLPLEAGPGTEISSGSLNLESTLIIEVKRVGSETALARIIGLVEEAQARKAPIQTLADQVAGNFCYGVLALAAFTFLFWWQLGTRIWPDVLHTAKHSFFHGHAHSLTGSLGAGADSPLGLALQLAIAVLVVACPCALGLATPTVITVASGQAARRGWLFKGGDVIEMAASLKQIIFDKTGTLTIGRPLVVETREINQTKNPNELLQLAASLEQESRHPLAHAILQEAQRLQITPMKAIKTCTSPGQGISGEIQEVEGIIRVGKPEWLQQEGIAWTAEFQRYVDNAALKGHSVLAVAKEKVCLGLVMINDQLRMDVDIALNRLRKQGHTLNMLSGDRSETVKRLGKQLGFKETELGWQLLPNQKLQELEKLRQIKSPIAMVGDGINDAPALAASDLGIAIGTGTQIAQESAKLVLLGDRLESLPEAILLARKTMIKVKQNLFWAFGYNMIALPIAAGVLLPGFGILLSPPIAALLMAMSSITVVINALSLRSS